MKLYINRKSLIAIIATAFGLLLFQNCSKTKFSDGDATAASAGATGTGATGTASGVVADPPPTGVTICALGNTNTCDLGHAFIGNLYIQPRNLLIDSGTLYANGPIQGDMDVNDYIANSQWLATKVLGGQKQPLVVALSSLDSLNNQFASGFKTQDGETVQVPDAQGNLGAVPNYFALDLRGKFHLSASDDPGLYQIAVVADDGAQIYLTDADGSNPKLLIDDQIPGRATNSHFIPGSQYARMGCSTVIGDTSKIQTLTMQMDTVTPIEVRYLNGPSGLSLRLMYRKVPSSGPVDPFCETDVNGDPSTKPSVDLPTVLDTNQLTTWKPITADNL